MSRYDEFEINLEKGSNNITIDIENVVKEIKPDYESLEITPTTEKQIREGSFNKVTVAGDENLKAENISKGTSIFGVEGTVNTTSLKITDASYLFYRNSRIDDIAEFLKLCDNVTTCKFMFSGCNDMSELNLLNLNTSEITDMSYMFDGCFYLTSLLIDNFNTDKVTNMAYMFATCRKLETLDLSHFNTDNVTSMTSMFSGCSKLTSLNVSSFNTKNVTGINSMFSGCNSLIDLDISNFDVGKATSIGGVLVGMTDLTNLKSFKNLGKAFTQKTQNYSGYKLDLSSSKKLTHESLLDVINNLYDLNLSYDVANGGTLYRQSLVLGSTNLAKLTEEEIAIATNKGWNVT